MTDLTGKWEYSYISFVSQTKFLGGVILKAGSARDALTRVQNLVPWEAESVLMVPLLQDDMKVPIDRYVGRILGEQEVREVLHVAGTQLEVSMITEAA